MSAFFIACTAVVLNEDITGIVLMFVGMLNGLIVAFTAVLFSAIVGHYLTVSTFITCVWVCVCSLSPI